MKIINVPGLSGLGFGDFVAGIAGLITLATESTHFRVWVKQGYQFPEIVDSLFPMYKLPEGVKISWEVIEGDHRDPTQGPFRNVREAKKYWPKNEYKRSWFLLGTRPCCMGSGKYSDFTKQWKGDKTGPVLVCTNSDHIDKDYPAHQKWLDTMTNDTLLGLVDNKRFFRLTNEVRDFQENIELMQGCSRIIGLDCRWTHIANCMNVPYILLKADWNKYKHKSQALHHIYSGHPCLKMIENYELPRYMTVLKKTWQK